MRISWELHLALVYRRTHRIFGNIDNNIKELTALEIVDDALVKVSSRMAELFERQDPFLARMTRHGD